MLSPNVKNSLEEAQANLRIALFHASKNEKSIVNKQIADIMYAIESLMKLEKMSDQMEEMMNKMNEEGGHHFYGGLF